MIMLVNHEELVCSDRFVIRFLRLAPSRQLSCLSKATGNCRLDLLSKGRDMSEIMFI